MAFKKYSYRDLPVEQGTEGKWASEQSWLWENELGLRTGWLLESELGLRTGLATGE